MTDRPSELENVVLGIVWKEGPVTPHAIRMHFAVSRNTRFSASTGAIYPLVRRLEERGLLASSAGRRGEKQKRRLYSISDAGLARLREWISPTPEAAAGVPHDPVRLRLYFLGALPRAGRAAFFDAAERGFRDQLVLLKEDLDHYRRLNSAYSIVATEGAIALCRAQLRWIVAARTALAAT